LLPGSSCERPEQCFSFICTNSICDKPAEDSCLEKDKKKEEIKLKDCEVNKMKEGCPEFC